ncbi:class I SAM-dependent methyltransferase [Bradyrhizobium sp. NBAIM20]|uniref:Class I SAM-dependent methyltransferase n=1 Tax=Bradyrhizobium yuanmingense TaxID=108015 RepID=A0ABV4GRR4_9BRAD|nr:MULTISPECIES: class I SAM-dependent methyltransferase [Bradyrhizobium]MCA1413391.1 class I SAM-dependent methyltransferase [Bradyrhizobium sp. NBAIM20]MCA1466034.1 class I SAM-dependent methyltransferase [Bradyrhizobium sp. NBAIM18]
MHYVRKSIYGILDLILTPVVLLFAPLAVLLGRLRDRAPLSRSVCDRFQFAIVRHHYYEPIVLAKDLKRDLDIPREITGLNLNEAAQLELIEQFNYRDELLEIPTVQKRPDEFGYHNGSFEAGDAEFLYNMIRHFKPKRIVEVGSGNSTLMARLAIEANGRDSPGYRCEQICIEPFEQPWLESAGVTVLRRKVECCPDSLFEALGENDILFIDSSHIIRPQGDVLHEYLHVLGLLRHNVLVHVHDVFTPHDYPAQWLLRDRWLWNEQYLLEAFLSFNAHFEIIGAVNWLARNHKARLNDACPVLMREPWRQPGSFWFRRVGK